MGEERIEMNDVPSSAPQFLENGDIKEALRVLDNNLWLNDEQILRPWGSQKITLVHLAAFRGHIGMLKRAAALDVDLYALDAYDRSALYYAADQGHINVIEWLMDQPAAHEGPSERTSPTEDQASPSASGSDTAPHQVVQTQPQETVLLVEQSEGDKLRKRSPSSFDIQDKNGWTPLHAAVYGRHLECVRILIEKGLCLANATKTGVTVMKAIFEEVPNPSAFLKEILDKQVSAADDSGHKVNLDFTILAAPANCARVQEVESTSIANLVVVLALHNAIRYTKDLEILEHPLVTTFIHLKFPLTTPFYLFILLCDLYNAIVLYQYYTCTTTRIVMDPPTSKALQGIGITLNVVAILMTISDIVGNCRDKVARICFMAAREYIVLISLRFLLAVYALVVIEILRIDCLNPLYATPNAIMNITYWFHILLTLALVPIVGLYIHMFLAVLVNVLWVLAIFGVLIIGFSLTFGLLYYDIDQFSTPGKAFGKTLVMMTGEYDYDHLFPSNKTDVTPSVVTRAGIFFIFLIVIGIVLMNLMIGLAVNDTKKLSKKSRTAWLARLVVLRFQWIGVCYLISRLGTWISRLRTRFQNGEQTKEFTRTVLLDLKSTSRIPWYGLPRKVKNGLYELALKNSSNRDEKSQADLLRDDMRESFTALQTIMLKEIRSILQSSLQGVVNEQQLQNCQIQQQTQNRVTERQRRSLPTILWRPKIDSRASPTT